MIQKNIKKVVILNVLFLFGACQFSETPKQQTKTLPTIEKAKTLNRAVLPINFMQTSLDDALKMAKKSDKIVFVDVYTNWCKPCREMDKFVFSDARVGEFFNKNFVNFKLNAQNPENKKIAHSYGVTAYPTLIFLDKNGESLLSSMGYIDAEMLLEYGKEILADSKK